MASKEHADELRNLALKPVEISVEVASKAKGSKPGLIVHRRFTKPDTDVFEMVEWDKRNSLITDERGNIVSQINDVEVPRHWSQLATDIVTYKYFRKAGVKNDEGRETSVRQTTYRIAHTMADFGEKFGYFRTKADRETFEAELLYLLITQRGAFNSPVWFNCGLYHQYDIEGQGGAFYWDFKQNKVLETKSAYRNPQCSACFILSVKDSLPGIFELVKTESHIFKYGSGAGANFSPLRSRFERLSGGGYASGMLSFLRVFDRAAGATKSGGTTRRAAKMVVVDISHPEIEDFIEWKVKEEKKVAALIAAGYETDFNGEAYSTVSGQNSNNSVRITDEFMRAYENDGEWQTKFQTTGEAYKTYKARHLMDKIAQAAWQCADPGVQFDTIINEWHTCPNTGRINASNPCVTGRTLVATDGGYRRIRELVDQKVNIVGKDGQIQKATKIWKTGHKPIFRLETESGYSLELTADHRVTTINRGDIPASQLDTNDIIQLEGARFGRTTIENEAAELIGLMVGDGCVTYGNKNQSFAFLAFNKLEQPIAVQVAQTISSVAKAAVGNGEFDNRSTRPTQVYPTATGLRVGTSSQPVLNMLNRYAILDQGSSEKRFTDEIFNLDQESTALVLRGLFTADGTVANYGSKSQYVSLDSVSLELLQQVQLLLLSFKIKAKIYKNRRGNMSTSYLPNGKNGYHHYHVKPLHSLRISRSSRVVFERFINFSTDSVKSMRLTKMNRTVNTYHESLTDQVARLTPVGTADVFDLTEPVNHHFVANGLVVHNCSEYMFLDDSACNLASINLVKFVDEQGNFDVASYRHAIRIFFTAQEIEVDLSSYPTEAIARNSHDYRPLGLGYANLGTLLMLWGIPYDSKEALAISGALTAVLTGYAYKTSAEMAAVKGPFAGFLKNRAPMLEVMRKHRSAAYRIKEKNCPTNLLEAAHQDWDEAVALGEQFGYRNSQATVIAPTGTIGLLMDCDTTGIEPDFALIKFKKLAGGGSIKIVNQAVGQALANLGYSPTEQKEIIDYALGTATLAGKTPINRASLQAKGLTEPELDQVEKSLVSAFDINYVFNRFVLGDEAMKRLGITSTDEQEPDFSLLKKMGFSETEISQSNAKLCGRQTTEGAPHLKLEHYAVFDCANKCGPHGTRFISPLAHVRMMAAAQPFVSGAISKTINLPREATVEDVKEVYIESWKQGLKALALYRDGSKLSQPLNTTRDSDTNEEAEPPVAAVSVPTVSYQPRRRRLPDERQAITHKFQIAGHEGYITIGLFENGQPGEIFVTMAKQGSVINGLMDSFATSISIALQYGVPLSVLVKKFSHSRFEPSGFTGNPQIRIAKSITDYIARYVGIKFLTPEEKEELGIKADNDIPVSQAPLEFGLDLELPAAPTESGAKAAPITVTAAVTPQAEPSATPKIASTDSPPCPNCGSLTFKTGSCYTCLSCGSSTGGCN